MKRALVSVTNKDGIVDFCKGLVELGFEIVSTGGTMAKLQEANIPCIAIDDVTGFPEILDGRVKKKQVSAVFMNLKILQPSLMGGFLLCLDTLFVYYLLE